MNNLFGDLARGLGNAANSGQQQSLASVLNAVPPELLQQALTGVLGGLPKQEYYNHTQPGVGGTDPLGALPKDQFMGLAGALIGALAQGALNPQQVQQSARMGSIDPSRMSPQDLAALAQWLQANRPDLLAQTATQYRQQPDLLSTLLGNQAVQQMLLQLGANFLRNQFGMR